MTILKTHFYHKTISLYTAVFGNCFNGLSVVRDDGTEILVPIAYAGKPKYNARLEAGNNTDDITFMSRTPRMSFQLTGFQRDQQRVKSKFFKLSNIHSHDPATSPISSQYNRVPYNFTYQLDITTKYIDDMLQLVEQIFVNFNPTVSIVVEDNPDLDDSSAILISLASNSFQNNFEGTFDNKRDVTFTLEFTLEGYLYMPSDYTGVIKHVTINWHDLSLDDTPIIETDTYNAPEDVIPNKDEIV